MSTSKSQGAEAIQWHNRQAKSVERNASKPNMAKSIERESANVIKNQNDSSLYDILGGVADQKKMRGNLSVGRIRVNTRIDEADEENERQNNARKSMAHHMMFD